MALAAFFDPAYTAIVGTIFMPAVDSVLTKCPKFCSREARQRRGYAIEQHPFTLTSIISSQSSTFSSSRSELGAIPARC